MSERTWRSIKSGSPAAKKLALLLLLASLAACVAQPVALPQGYQQPAISFFVAHAPGDDAGMEQAIAAELRRRNLNASGGLYEHMPPDTDVLVIYSDSWWANILAQGEILRLEARDARTGHTIASAERRWVSYIFDVPDALVADTVGDILGAPPP